MSFQQTSLHVNCFVEKKYQLCWQKRAKVPKNALVAAIYSDKP